MAPDLARRLGDYSNRLYPLALTPNISAFCFQRERTFPEADFWGVMGTCPVRVYQAGVS